MGAHPKLLAWLREACAAYKHDVVALYRRAGDHSWPLHARDDDELDSALRQGGHFLPLPKEPAALANILEVAIVDFLIANLKKLPSADFIRGTERGYPDIEFHGDYFGGGFHAIDVKIAMRKKTKRPLKPGVSGQTQSRITLYTGNTYFKHPDALFPGIARPFSEYISHIDVLGIYTLNEGSTSRVDNLELIVQEPWRIASTKRSSTTREYLGAVLEIDRLREGRGDFETEEAFYKYWRAFKFKASDLVGKQFERLIKKGSASVPKKGT